MIRLAAVLIAAALAAAAGPALAQRSVPLSQAQIQLSFAPVVKRAAPAVVNVYARKIVQTRARNPLFNDPFFRRFFGQLPGFNQAQPQNSLGSGVIVDEGGIILTNSHVIAGADDIRVVLKDRREFDAELISADEQTDLAVLRIDPGGERLPALAFGDSEALEVGDLVLAIGNPFGVGQTVTSGIVSALARTQVGTTDFGFFIQTDAAINPGNSGGALVDMQGRLVGVNTAIYSRSGGSNGIGFAIPATIARLILRDAESDGRATRPWMGISAQGVNPDAAQALGLDRPGGALISNIYPGGPADRAGLRPGDVVLSVDGQRVDDPNALRFYTVTKALGSTASLEIVSDGRTRTVILTVDAPPDRPPRNETAIAGRNPFNGATIANLNPALADEMGLDAMTTGIAITNAGTAQRLGLRARDIVIAVNGARVGDVRDLQRAVAQPQANWEVVVQRGERRLRLRFRG